MTLTLDDLSHWQPCNPAKRWARVQPDQSLAAVGLVTWGALALAWAVVGVVK